MKRRIRRYGPIACARYSRDEVRRVLLKLVEVFPNVTVEIDECG